MVTKSKVKTAILLANMGGPRTTNDVKSYLTRLFSDSDIINLPLQSITSKVIVNRRTPKIIAQYSSIGGGSPIFKWTNTQGRMLQELLDKKSPITAPHKCYIGFRYADPLTEHTINEIENDGAERAILFSQYQQYSCTTSGSSVNAFTRHYTSPKLHGDAGIDNFQPPPSLKINQPPGPIWSLIDRWPTQPKMVEAFAQRIKDELIQMPEEYREKTVILFSAHSEPIEVVDRGDPYSHEVAATVYAVMQNLGFSNPYRLVWQSKVGPKKWLGPSTKDAIKGLARLGQQHIILVPIAFTSDHIETLFEVDQEFCKKIAEEAGIVNIKRAQSLNDHPIFIQGLAELVLDHLRSGQLATRQFFLRCPGCINEACAKSRQFIKTQEQRVKEWTMSNFS